MIFSATAFSHIFQLSDFHQFDISQNNIYRKRVGNFLNYFEYPAVSRGNQYWFWESWTLPPSPKNKNIMIFWKINPESYWSKVNQNNSTELSCCSFLKKLSENAPPPRQTPHLHFSSHFLDVMKGNRPCSYFSKAHNLAGVGMGSTTPQLFHVPALVRVPGPFQGAAARAQGWELVC